MRLEQQHTCRSARAKNIAFPEPTLANARETRARSRPLPRRDILDSVLVMRNEQSSKSRELALALFMIAVIAAIAITVACTSSPPCAPIAPHDAGGCGQTFDVDYDPSTQTGCAFAGGMGTSETCASLCGATSSCELITFSSVECTTTCGAE